MNNVPQWFRKGNIYQINPRTFSEEGTLNSITKELAFIASLNVKIIYLCPIFKEDDVLTNRSKRQLASGTGNPKNPYRMNNYFELDTEYGTMDDLRKLIDAAHSLNMKVILDLVYFHTGINADFIKDFPDFVVRDECGKIILGEWNFPLLNFKNQGLREFLWANMVYYIGVLNADGFRCDVGDNVPLDFWQEGKKRIQAIKPDIIMINEGRSVSHLKNCFDANYSFDWHEAVYEVLSKKATVKKLVMQHAKETSLLPENSILMRDIDNHDTVTDWPQRTEVVAGHNGMECATVMNYILDGIPMIYCGNELGDTKKLSMFANRFYMGAFEITDRSDKNSPYSLRRQQILKKLNKFREENDVLCCGKTIWLKNSCEDEIVSFERHCKNEKIIYLGNFSDNYISAAVDLCLNDYEIIFESEIPLSIENGVITFPPYAYGVLKYKE